jgi:hypothetical protein
MNSPVSYSTPAAASASSTLSLRLAMVAYLVAVAASFVLVFYSVIFMRAELLAGAGVSGAIALAARAVLRERMPAGLNTETVFDEETISPEGPGTVESCRIAGLMSSLREWDALEQARGSADFDPWALQSARHEIRSAVSGDPMLERLFRPHN